MPDFERSYIKPTLYFLFLQKRKVVKALETDKNNLELQSELKRLDDEIGRVREIAKHSKDTTFSTLEIERMGLMNRVITVDEAKEMLAEFLSRIDKMCKNAAADEKRELLKLRNEMSTAASDFYADPEKVEKFDQRFNVVYNKLLALM
jgi:hypothetical protein